MIAEERTLITLTVSLSLHCERKNETVSVTEVLNVDGEGVKQRKRILQLWLMAYVCVSVRVLGICLCISVLRCCKINENFT